MKHLGDRCLSVHVMAASTLVLSLTCPVAAQNVPAVDTDSWIRFPSKPRPSAKQVDSSPSTPPLVKTTSDAKPTERGTSDRPGPLLKEPEESWVRFPVRSNRDPAAIRGPSETPNTLANGKPERVEPVSSSAVAKVEATQETVKPQKIIGFRTQGNERVHSDEISQILEKHLQQDITQQNLSQAIDTVNDLYRSKQLLALVEMPAQDLTEGLVHIKITEARFAGLVVEDPSGQMARNPELPYRIMENFQPVGDLLSLPALDTVATTINDIPGLSAKISLRPGAEVGQTQAVALLEEGTRVQAAVSLDNSGARATGEWRESTKIMLNNPLKMGDAASIQQLHSLGLDHLRAAYSVPVGGGGWRAGINASGTKYQVISPEMQPLNARGPSSSVGVDLTIPITRTAHDKLTLQLAADQRQYRNDAVDVIQSNYRGSTISGYLESTHHAPLGAETVASILLVKGHLDLSTSTVAHRTWDSLTTRTEGAYTKSRIALTHQQPINPSNTLVANLQAQSVSKNVDSSEKFFLGGPMGVRAYATNEAGGSQGYLASLELQHHINWPTWRMTTSGFVDTGRITINKFNDFVGAPSVNQYGLSGVGFWVGAMVPNRYGVTTMRLTASHRIGLNPGSMPQTGFDQDGKYVLNRIWYSLTQTF